ncbi:MAG: glutamine--fructose-6-phosphate transaminase (isomerizing) [Candidatus Omnitrophota bacterium]|nr:MAG: glutamine--fructose-6-phosphate transaminase (isomerizing) [Candidatus Omnitrophota bacterium]
MCGIVGYTGKREAKEILIKGLKNLEYRGYDSAGVAVLAKNRLKVVKRKGKIKNLEELVSRTSFSGSLGIAHTRWATHGVPSDKNAHPHLDCKKRIAVVHNGIIENFEDLKKDLLRKGCKFSSDTDTEVISHLIERNYHQNLEEAVRRTALLLKGSFSLAVISRDEPDKLVGVRLDSPLIVGIKDGEKFLASDSSAFIENTRRVVYLKDREIAILTPDSVKVVDFQGRRVSLKEELLNFSKEEVKKCGFKHFMLKEILEQPKVLEKIISYYLKDKDFNLKELTTFKDFFKKLQKINIVACGTAYHAGLVGKYLMEKFLKIPVEVDLGSEFRYKQPTIRKGDLLIAISQSGETADTLAGVRLAKKRGAKILSICNVLGSTLVRESDKVIYTLAGPEISVASTKAYSAQIMVLVILSLYLARLRKTLPEPLINSYLNLLRKVPSYQLKIVKSKDKIRKIAQKYLNFGAFLYLGRNINYPTALEGALKLKEISYIPAEGYPAGEMKHGPIALIDEYRAVVCIANNSSVYLKMLSNVEEIFARRGKIIILASEGDKQVKKYSRQIIYIPQIREELSPLITIIPLQLLAYYIAELKGYDVDKPRNLAKSVTVE